MNCQWEHVNFFKKGSAPMRYYVNKNAQGDGFHEVHTVSCAWLPDIENRIYLGDFSNGKDAVKVAKQYYSNVDGCYYCNPEAHTR